MSNFLIRRAFGGDHLDTDTIQSAKNSTVSQQVLPPGTPTPNYIDPPTLAPIIFGVGISFSVLSLIFVVGRMWSRHYLLRRVGFEDHLIIFSWFMSVFLVFCCCWSTRYGVGLHWWDIKPEVWIEVPVFPAQYVSTIVYPTATTAIKFSILIFYSLLTPSIRFNRAVRFTMVFTFLVYLGTVLANVFQCTPVKLVWHYQDLAAGKGTCVNQLVLWICGAALHVLTDIIIFILPIPLIYTSQLPIRQKMNAMVIFALGLLLVIASVIRLQMNIITLDPEQLMDYNWTGSRAMAWTTMEVNVGIIVACPPGIRPLLAHYLPRWFMSPEAPTPRIQHPQKPPNSTDDIEIRTTTDGGATETTSEEYPEKKRGSFLDSLWDAKDVVKMSIKKSASGNNLKVGRNESTADIVQKEDV